MRDLIIDIHSEWRSGTGRGEGLHVDAETRRDELGLPMLPGRQLKGLIRHALETGAAWGHWPAELADILCGQSADDQRLSRFDTTPSLISVSSARMSEEWLNYFSELKLAGERGRETAVKSSRHLYRVKRQTALNARGVAQDHSLRSVEVCVPMALYARISGELSEEQERHLRRALKLIRHVGGMTTRGLGQATLKLSQIGSER